MSPPQAQVVYQNGVSIIAEVNRIVFAQAIAIVLALSVLMNPTQHLLFLLSLIL
ncbi:hypothetical protein H6G97_17475 [Nostoc flagelliforme FACHB-838]|uniref:Uncharacterized protein n=1 Tax=Nostoc flagelliforme FACHB-838 TaxID=2692904 RepID=A0ABR8DPJ0_9NOSO|nr:hypothetical protein [Nostoc flagelliforme]MBD2531280.1 hypothetical protein [Nostoc flagelliforme FACHB-838]